MKKNFLYALTPLVLLLSACAPATAESTMSLSPSGTPTILPDIFTPRVTRIPQTFTPGATQIPPTETITPLPTIPTFTPTFDVRAIVTVAPARKAKCPKISSGIAYDSQNLEGPVSTMNQQFIDYTLRFLNSGGSIRSIRAQFMDSDEIIRGGDVTGDGVDELIAAYGIWVDIFGCNDGSFQLISVLTAETAQNSKILRVIDMNLDGLAEIVVHFDECWGWRCPFIEIYEWDGAGFRSLISGYSRCHGLEAPLETEIDDLDRNGTQELILSHNGKPFPDGIGFPYRAEKLICLWNGQDLVPFRSEFGPPHYRFQAVQDGDAAALVGDHSTALGFYKQAIFDEELGWFSRERSTYDFWIYHTEYFPALAEPTPTASPSLQPNPGEYPSLAAYAYYRIMLLHLVQRQEADARTAYSTLQRKFGSDPYGQPYVEMATVFWNAYQSTHNLYDGCAEAIQYAVQHPEILVPLGSDYHGSQSHIYVPADVCPFR